jgi:hypothetical protein
MDFIIHCSSARSYKRDTIGEGPYHTDENRIILRDYDETKRFVNACKRAKNTRYLQLKINEQVKELSDTVQGIKLKISTSLQFLKRNPQFIWIEFLL